MIMKLKSRYFVWCVGLVAMASTMAQVGRASSHDISWQAGTLALQVAAADNQNPKDRELKLISVLQSDASPAEKAITCKRLAVYGTKDAVPALAPLLLDKDLSSWARIALEAIPGPAADEALRGAMGKVQGRLLIGVINSIGVRRDAQAVDGLVAKLKDSDADVASAAAEALGHIGGDQAAKALERSLAEAPAVVVRPAAAEGCILCAEKYLAEGNSAEAVRLYDIVRQADLPKQRLLEATRGAILARGTAGVPLLVEQLKSADKARLGIGLRTARELPGREVTEMLAVELDRLSPDRQPLLLLALADRSDAAVLPAVLKAAQSGLKELRVTALGVLMRIGNVSCVPVLLEAAAESDAELAQTAKLTLAHLGRQDVDADLLARLPQATGKTRQALIELAGQRRIEGAVPVIMSSIGDPDAGVRSAAIQAVGAMGGDKQAADLVTLLQKTQNAKDRADIEKALMAISGRSGASCVPCLLPLMQNSDVALRTIGLHALAVTGGPDALAAVKSAIDDKDEAVQDEAARTLSTWPNNWPGDTAAAEALLTLVKSGKKMSHQVLGLRGYLQYVRGDKKLNDSAKVAKVSELLPLIQRPEEKRLAIGLVGAIRTAASLELLTTLASDPAVAEDAYSAIVNLADSDRSIPGVSREQRQKVLGTVIEKSKNDATKKKAEDRLKKIR
jgi:HEAT repeat protein